MSTPAAKAHYARLEAIGAEWDRLNPDACPDCKCRPGKGDADDGSDHEAWCRVVNPDTKTELVSTLTRAGLHAATALDLAESLIEDPSVLADLRMLTGELLLDPDLRSKQGS